MRKTQCRAVRSLLDRLGILEPPVDLDKLAKFQGVRSIVDAPMGDLWGSMTQSRTGITIRLNEDAPLKRRFTLAHEIAHTLVGSRHLGTTVTLMRRPKSYTALERTCDQLAAEILMPRHMFVPRLQRQTASLKTIVQLAEEFDSSIEATALRFGQLSAHNVRVIKWDVQEEQAHVRWSRGGLGSLNLSRGASLPLADLDSVAHASTCEHTAVGIDMIARTPVYSEARALGQGKQRYVLSLIKPRPARAEVRGRQLLAHRDCKHNAPRKESSW